MSKISFERRQVFRDDGSLPVDRDGIEVVKYRDHFHFVGDAHQDIQGIVDEAIIKAHSKEYAAFVESLTPKEVLPVIMAEIESVQEEEHTNEE